MDSDNDLLDPEANPLTSLYGAAFSDTGMVMFFDTEEEAMQAGEAALRDNIRNGNAPGTFKIEKYYSVRGPA